MEKKMKGDLLKRLLAVVLALTVAVTFVPLLGDIAYAEGDEDQAVEVEAANPAGAVTDNPVDVTVEEATDGNAVDTDAGAAEGTANVDAGEAVIEDDLMDETNDTDTPDLKQILAESSLMSSVPEDMSKLPSIKSFLRSDADFHAAASNDIYSVSASVSGNKAYVKGSIAEKYRSLLIFGRLFVDGSSVADISDYSFSTTINMSSFSIGYHTIYYEFIVYNPETGKYEQRWDSTKYIPSKITQTPNYSGKFYYVYSNYMDYFPFTFGGNLGGNVYMEYSNNGGKTWTRTGYMKANAIKLYLEQKYTFRGLKPNTNYKTRIRYGQSVTYSEAYNGDGKAHFFLGPVRNLATIKTGMAKSPKIKSIKVKAVKVKKHKVRHYGYYTGVYLYTEKYYTYKLKVTVKLKKKPGTNGLWINGKFVKGNKKNYKVTLPGSSYSKKKPKGKKFTVMVSSYQNTSWGGLSPLYKKVKKIK